METRSSIVPCSEHLKLALVRQAHSRLSAYRPPIVSINSPITRVRACNHSPRIHPQRRLPSSTFAMQSLRRSHVSPLSSKIRGYNNVNSLQSQTQLMWQVVAAFWVMTERIVDPSSSLLTNLARGVPLHPKIFHMKQRIWTTSSCFLRSMALP